MTRAERVLATEGARAGREGRGAGYCRIKARRAVRGEIAYVGQKGGADQAVSGRDELVFQGRLYGLRKADSVRRAVELLKVLELEDCADRVSNTYSGGQRRRLDIGIGLMHGPKLLFLDEPTTGLDPQSRARLWDEVRRLRDSGTTIFLTTHYLEEADALCDRLAIIDHGKIVAAGSPHAL